MRRRGGIALVAIAIAVLVVIAGVACSSDKHGSSPRINSSHTTASRQPFTDYSKNGPFQAGTMSAALEDGRRVVIWYPADPSAARQPEETLDLVSLLSPTLQAKVPADLRRRIQYSVDAHPGADPATGGPFPVVLFSHGYAGLPEESVNLTTHLAQWGFVVVAPDHVERSLDGLLGTAAQNIKRKLTDVQVLSQSLDLALAENRRPGSPLNGLVNAKQVAVAGHSAGAEAAYDLASADRRIKAFISYSVSLGGPDGQPVPSPPRVPGMVMVGTKDRVTSLAANHQVYAGMRTPRYFAKFAGAGHNVFSDICEIARREGGVVKVVHQIGLDIPPSLLKLADDGCKASNLDPRDAFPAINYLSVAFLRSALGLDHSRQVHFDLRIATVIATAHVTLEQVS